MVTDGDSKNWHLSPSKSMVCLQNDSGDSKTHLHAC